MRGKNKPSWDGAGLDGGGFSEEFPSPLSHLKEFGEEAGKGRANEP